MVTCVHSCTGCTASLHLIRPLYMVLTGCVLRCGHLLQPHGPLSCLEYSFQSNAVSRNFGSGWQRSKGDNRKRKLKQKCCDAGLTTACSYR